MLVKGTDVLGLSDIEDGRAEGKQVLASARFILGKLGKPDASFISLADMGDMGQFVAGLQFNGDGVICPGQVDDPAVRVMLAADLQARVDTLIARDKAMTQEILALEAVERLIRYQRDLFKLVNNFVSFREFYSGRGKAVFQAGTLYLDGRSCELCVKVDDVNAHATFANSSGVCLVYCELVRGSEKMHIAAAFTAIGPHRCHRRYHGFRGQWYSEPQALADTTGGDWTDAGRFSAFHGAGLVQTEEAQPGAHLRYLRLGDQCARPDQHPVRYGTDRVAASAGWRATRTVRSLRREKTAVAISARSGAADGCTGLGVVRRIFRMRSCRT